MTRRALILAGLACLAACQEPDVTGPPEGTFVGNPSMTARLADNDVQQVRGGVLVALEVFLTDCAGVADIPLGARTITFDGSQSTDVVQVPTGEHCGLFLVVDELRVRYDEGGSQSTTLIADDFDLSIPASFFAEQGGDYTLRLGDEAWLAEVAALAGYGEILVDGGDPALELAFFRGLTEGSAIEGDVEPTTTEAASLPGRLNLEDYPTSPSGLPSVQAGCGTAVNFDMAVAIPPAAMATLGLGDQREGWCEGSITFSDDLAELTAIQLDYSDLSTYPVSYNGWGQDCGELHCNEVVSYEGVPQGRPCTLLVFCDGEGGEAVATGFYW